ncbi:MULTISPECIES: acetyl-CoA carboxylase, carboxyltransferase subunit beta [unclassified Paenibacillus]|uniref:acetyl-CoA carboxylase, carboxyltransferase subunit beta n=1 Tax=Paenibacillus TaxID=44249 RepID=UPI00020D7B09|nr:MULTISPECIES: acetyl-CoA carboxylase, carboxyltransferase subunit beta [unclassified Paenibacillus]EGL14935.1 acetyl-CoA carboxylase, carboxyl transferase, beta subunit [Paenibacillus sp. HGF7]EPD82152.1 acetyl-CoA carboxylase, carboxyl transferase, beta subunit [Paenibacillus sp. HGH0039]MBV6714085.1 acetyl-CoA carboxylase, carboxyltransferase subunit beta [Paenibacillus chitinolyticus]
MLKDLFQKRKYATIPSEKAKRDIPEGLMNKCPRCGTIQYSKELEKNLKVCTSCNYHYKLNAMERMTMTLDEGRLFEYDENMISEDPLGFPDYENKITKAKDKTGLKDAIVTGEGTIGGYPVVFGAMSFDFMGGSLGSVVGEKLTRAIESAIQKKYPLILFSTSGGARMQESILSLMQMAKTSAAIQKLDSEGGLFVSVITDPTFGGVSASFAMLGDIIIAEPAASFGFTGRRVIEQTIKQKLPDNFQTAEFNLLRGQVDKVVARKDMRTTLIKLLDMHVMKGDANYGG